MLKTTLCLCFGDIHMLIVRAIDVSNRVRKVPLCGSMGYSGAGYGPCEACIRTVHPSEGIFNPEVVSLFTARRPMRMRIFDGGTTGKFPFFTIASVP